MADDDDSQIVTEFLIGTYRLQPTLHEVRAVLESAGVANHPVKDDPEADAIPLISGSSAELYIKPMLSCVDDIDIMNHRNTLLAIPDGYPAPTRLPDEFHSRVAVYEIVDTEYPGYVYLRARHLLTENIDDGRYNALIDYYWPWPFYSSTRPSDADTSIHGPANTILAGVGKLAVDRVDCMRCLSWPSQAADWPTRHRNEGWPDSATVDRVVNNGCDIVHAAHRLCRHDPRLSKFQHRLSFSRAEIVLLNSWRPIKQIVYHMLRIFMKTERLTDVTDNTGTKIISNYHIKTLMLWACEMKPRNWWLNDRNAVIICVELLRVLTDWLTDSHCKHYFISTCNIMDSVVNQERITAYLTSVTESWLSTWFVNNYIMKCAQRCPGHVKRLFDDVSTSVRLRIAASSVVVWRRTAAELHDMLEVCNHAEYLVLAHAFRWSQRVRSYDYFVKTITKLDVLHTDYLTAVALLHIAIKFTNHDVDIELMDVLSTLSGQSVGRRRYSSQRNSLMLLSQAVKLMNVVENNSRSTVQLLEIELSKEYLYRALRCNVSDNDSICCLSNVYLAVLYYNTGQYQTAIDHCTLVVRSQDHSQCSSHVVQGDLLPKINAGVHNVLGLAVFYRYVRTAALNHKRTQHIIVFSTKLFAQYMFMSCLSATECHHVARAVSMNEVQHCYLKDIGDRQLLFIDDLLLFKFSISPIFRHYQHHHQPTINPTGLNTTKLVELLQQFAVEHLTTFRQLQAREFTSSFLRYHVTTEFEAMYAYQRGDYQLCLQLSTQNVRTLLNLGRLHDVYTFPEFIQLLDGDIVSLTALTLIVNPECRTWSLNVGITQLTLSLYLMTQCQLKLRHSATQVAQILVYIQAAHRRHPADAVLDHLTLKLTKRKIILHLRHNLE